MSAPTFYAFNTLSAKWQLPLYTYTIFYSFISLLGNGYILEQPSIGLALYTVPYKEEP